MDHEQSVLYHEPRGPLSYAFRIVTTSHESQSTVGTQPNLGTFTNSGTTPLSLCVRSPGDNASLSTFVDAHTASSKRCS